MEKNVKDWKSLWKKFLILPSWLTVGMTLFCTVVLVLIFINNWETYFFAYAAYVISFYTLIVICIACVRTIPVYYKNMKGKVYKNKYANHYLTDAAYKTHINLYVSLAVNLLYIATNAVSAVIYRTHWFAIFAVYYAIMAVIHFLLVRYVKVNEIGKSRLGELKRSRMCAAILMTVNITLSGVVLMMIYYDKGFRYQGYFIYVMALYTFYITAAAVVNLVKYRKYHSPVMSVSKIIKLASSLFSMLFLETAMFSQFGQDTAEEFKKIMIMATGAGICVIVVSMSVFIIVRSSIEIKKIKRMECPAESL